MIFVRGEVPEVDRYLFEFCSPLGAAREPVDGRRIRALHSLAIQERLEGKPGNVIHTSWLMVAPDKLSYTSRQAGDAVVIGDRRWDRAVGSRRWVPSTQDPLRLPALDWNRVIDPSLLGSGTYAGHPVWRVAFRDPTIPAWFEVDLDKRTGMQVVVRMTAAAHFMVRRYDRFDQPLSIRRPPGVG